uniref:Uncharacterized protein n=1 Tax=Dracunculus medinensis TaxID=318479 RepID=A0A0N4U8Z0_DRAME
LLQLISHHAYRNFKTIQYYLQLVLHMSFEVIVALGDLVLLTTDKSDLKCKIFIENKFILAYATPVQHGSSNISLQYILNAIVASNQANNQMSTPNNVQKRSII